MSASPTPEGAPADPARAKPGRVVRIGGASAFYGDSAVAAPQLIAGGAIDYLVFDYLAEVTMAILARAKAKRPDEGYAVEFVTVAMAENLAEARARGVRIITNAGGQNPHACAAALAALAKARGVAVSIAVVDGDDVLDQVERLRAQGVVEMYSGAPMPETLVSANAYLGARPIAEALAAGADIVITGRVVDSALTLGPLIHEFGWSLDDHDRLAQGSLAGHIIECGAQATGGLHTDWEAVPDWAHIGYPVIECRADGAFIVTKPPGTGGLVTPATVGEQLLYEIGDPQAYLLPDVACDFTEVTIDAIGPDAVLVAGARGRPPTATYKVCANHRDGHRSVAVLPVVGIDARRKAIRQAEAVIERTREMFRARNLGDYRRVLIEPLGAEASYGAKSRMMDAREVITKIAVEHDDPAALAIFAREVAAPITSMAPGSTGWFGSGRPDVAPVLKLFSFTIPKAQVRPRVTIGARTWFASVPTEGGFDPATINRPPAPQPPPFDLDDLVAVPLIRLAWARSGDKGDIANVGVIARRADYLPWLRRALTPDAVRAHMAHHFDGAARPQVMVYDLPGFGAINLMLHGALDGGGTTSLRLDPLAKSFGQQILEMTALVPRALSPP